jgi:hypothetical protein
MKKKLTKERAKSGTGIRKNRGLYKVNKKLFNAERLLKSQWMMSGRVENIQCNSW